MSGDAFHTCEDSKSYVKDTDQFHAAHGVLGIGWTTTRSRWEAYNTHHSWPLRFCPFCGIELLDPKLPDGAGMIEQYSATEALTELDGIGNSYPEFTNERRFSRNFHIVKNYLESQILLDRVIDTHMPAVRGGVASLGSTELLLAAIAQIRTAVKAIDDAWMLRSGRIR